MKKTFKKKKKKSRNVSKESFQASKELINALEIFIEYAPPRRLSRNLRKMFFLWLDHEKDGLPFEFEDFIIDLYFLFDFMDVAIEESKDRS
jgi:hypothetical protein